MMSATAAAAAAAAASFAALEAELARRRPIASRLRQHVADCGGHVPASLCHAGAGGQLFRINDNVP